MNKSYLLVLLSLCLGTFGINPTIAQISDPITTPEPSPIPTPIPSPTIPPDPSPEPFPSPTPMPSPIMSPQSGVDSKQELKTQLEEQLKSQNWQEADKTTYKLMLAIAGENSSQEGRFDTGEWKNFSSSSSPECIELKEIDELWRQASQGSLGFSVQKRLFEDERNNPTRFYERIRWKEPNSSNWKVAWRYNPQTKEAEYLIGKEPNYSNPPEGHLPAMLEWQDPVDRRFEAIYQCGL